MPVGQMPEIDGSRLLREIQTVAKKYKYPAYVFVSLLSLYAIVRGVKGAAVLPFWLDEFFTLTIAGQPTVRDLWNLWKRGIDAMPPLFFLIERLTLNIPIKKEVALRLPSILAFPCILICVFAYVKKRGGELIACLCALLFLSTSLFHTYLIDARPYTEAVACIAFALVCYQRLPSPRWTVLFAISLILAESLHYYAIFAMIPFWLAESIVFFRARKFRWAVWLALFLGPLSLVSALPVFWSVPKSFGPHIFSRPVLSRVFDYYGTYFVVDRASGLALLVVSVAAIIWSLVGNKPRNSSDSGERDLDLSQGTLLLGLNLLPFFAFVAIRMAHGWLLDRYLLATTIGIILSVGCAVAVTRSNAVVAFLGLFVLTVVGLHEKQFWQQGGHDSFGESNYSAQWGTEFNTIQTLVESSGHPDLPVVFDAGPIYCQIVYYSAPEWTGRLVSLTDEDKELRYHGTDTMVKLFKIFHNYFPLRLSDYTGFTTQHSEFLLYSAPEGWMLDSMRRDGASVQILKNNGVRTVYLVKMREAPPLR